MGEYLKKLRNGIRKHPLRDDIKKCAPRLFGALAGPARTLRDASAIIDSVCETAAQPKDTADVFRAWITIREGRAWLQREYREVATAAIMDAEGKLGSKVWIFAFVHEPGDQTALVSAIREGLLDESQVSQFVSAALGELRRCGESELVFRSKGNGSPIITKESFRVASPMETLLNFERSGGHALLYYDTFDAIVRLVDLIVQISPTSVPKLIAASDHPALFALSAQTSGQHLRRVRPELMLDWISSDHPPPVVAAGLHEILEAVNFLDSAAENLARSNGESETEHRADYARGRRLITDMVDKLGTLHETQYGEPAGTLFSLAEYVLHRTREGVNDRLTLLRDSLEERTATVLRKASTPDLVIGGLLKGMLVPPRDTTIRHLDEIAQRLNKAERSDLSTQLYLALKANYERQIEEHRGKYFFVSNDEHGVAWTNALGRCGAVLTENGSLDICAWFEALLKTFALELWDYEEDHEQFSHDLRIALHLFSVCAVSAMQLRASGDQQLSSRLGRAIVESFLPLHETTQGLGRHVTDSHEAFAAPTVVAMMLALDEYADELRSLLRAQHTSVDVLAVVVRRSESDELRGLAREQLEARFDALRSLRSQHARWWILRWCELGDSTRAIAASLAFTEDLAHDREIGWKLLDVALRGVEQSKGESTTGNAAETIRGIADRLWGLWCPLSETARRDEARRRIAALGISCI